MRKLSAILLFIGIVIVSAQALAHPPNAMQVGYDARRGELNVIVQHPVTDPWKHFVKEVVVYRNGRKVWSQDFGFQTSHRNLTIPPIQLVAVDGDELKVVATSNTNGSYEKSIKVGAPAEDVPRGPIEHDLGEKPANLL